MNIVKYKFTKENINILWKYLVSDALFPEDQALFYKFLKEIVSGGSLDSYVTSSSDLSEFFLSMICDEKNNFQNLQSDGIHAIESLFLHVNIALNYIKETSRIRYEKCNQIGANAALGRAGYWEVTHEEKVEFKVKAHPNQIKGLPILWKIAMEAKCEEVTSKAIELLNMFYTKLGEELEPQIAEISSNFVETAIEKLKIFYANIIKDGINRNREIVKVVRLIEEMLNESERRGNGGITPLKCLPKGYPMKLEVLNYLNNSCVNTAFPERFPLQIHSNITFWQLKMMIANKLQVYPEMVKFIH